MNPVNNTGTRTRQLTMRLLRKGVHPEESLRQGAAPLELEEWDRILGSRLSVGSIGGHTPEWADFLGLPEETKSKLRNRSTYGILFIPADNRWFCITFGLGHTKLDSSRFETNFGLRVALNEIDPVGLRSVDVRSPDANTRMRRSQTSRGSDQSAFGIDFHQDIIRVIAGKPKASDFASRIAGADSLAIRKKVRLPQLPNVCSEAYAKSQEDTYKQHFGWIDHIAHVRDAGTLDELESHLTRALTRSLADDVDSSLHLAFPEIYDPEQSSGVRYRGFRSTDVYGDLDISDYLSALRGKNILHYLPRFLKRHRAHLVDDDMQDTGRNWRIGDCIGFAVEVDGEVYVLSGGKWYQIDRTLSVQVENSFTNLERVVLPPARVDENEPDYNKRIGRVIGDYLCLDRKLIRASGAATPVEICDLLGRNRQIIHVKNSSSASRLSHLFKQGTVAGRVLKVDQTATDSIRERIEVAQEEVGKEGFGNVIPASVEEFSAGDFTVVYAVITGRDNPKLSFFSLLSLHGAAEELRALGYRCAFSWIKRS